jgi:hypothetical protein
MIKKMAQSSDKTVKFISKLVKLTQDRRVDWTTSSPPRAGAETAFTTNIEGRKLRIYRYSNEVPNPDYAYFAGSTLSPRIAPLTTADYLYGTQRIEPPKTILRSGIVLELIEDDRAVYTFDSVTGLSDLYEGASYSASKVGDLMDAVLGKE